MNQIENNELRQMLAGYLNDMTVVHDDLIGQYRGELKDGVALAEIRQMESRIDSEIYRLQNIMADLQEADRARPKSPNVMQILNSECDMYEVENLIAANTESGLAMYEGRKMLRRLKNMKLAIEDAAFEAFRIAA